MIDIQCVHVCSKGLGRRSMARSRRAWGDPIHGDIKIITQRKIIQLFDLSVVPGRGFAFCISRPLHTSARVVHHGFLFGNAQINFGDYEYLEHRSVAFRVVGLHRPCLHVPMATWRSLFAMVFLSDVFEDWDALLVCRHFDGERRRAELYPDLVGSRQSTARFPRLQMAIAARGVNRRVPPR